MAIPTKEATLLTEAEQPQPEALEATPAVSMFERLARDPSVDVEKLQRLIDMQKEILRVNARAAFNASFSKMQPEIPAITEKGEIVVRGVLRSKYARFEDIQASIKPVLAKYGFALRHRTEWPGEGLIRIVGILTHEQGHAEESTFEAPMDRSEFRTDVQSQGSTISYGRRYTTIDLLSIETRGQDDDGQKSGRPTPPDGYDEWVVALSQSAEKGLAAVEKMFKDASKEYRAYLTQADADAYRKIRQRASTGKAVAS